MKRLAEDRDKGVVESLTAALTRRFPASWSWLGAYL